MLFHMPFLSRGRAVTLLEYRDAKVIFEVDDWFSMLPQAVKRYLLPLQSKYAKWYEENVRHLTQNYAFCSLCKQKESNLQRHYMCDIFGVIIFGCSLMQPLSTRG